MTRDGYDDRLGNVHLVHVFTDFGSGLVPVDKGHVAVHEDKAVARSLELVGFNVAYYNINCFLPI